MSLGTCTLNAYSKAYPFITNRIKASVLDAASPFAVVASIIDTTVGHPIRTYDFYGLPRKTYRFSLDEIDGGGAVVNNLADFTVSPSSLGEELARDDEQIKVDTTPGLTSETTTFTFDGTETSPGSGIFKPNYIGWKIVPSELAGGRGLMVENVDYSWNSVIAKFDLLQGGDEFNNGATYNIHFNCINSTAGNSFPTVTDFEIVFLDDDITLDDTYFGKKVIIEPLDDYAEIQLPSILTIPEGRRMMVEVSGDHLTSVEFKCFGSDEIDWLSGSLIAMTYESFSIYAFEHPTKGRVWRISEADGNFKSVGESISDDSEPSDVYNKQLYDGSSLNKFKYSRLYNFVLNLPTAQRVNYDDHATDNNKYLWSLANSSDPGNADEFLIPDRRGLFERNNSSGKPGDYYDDTVNLTDLKVTVNQGNSYTGNGGSGVVGRGSNSPNSFQLNVTSPSGGTETKPKNYLVNKYFKV